MSTVSKLSEIIDAAAGETVPIPSLLRRLKAVASDLDSTLLVDWVDLELSGYLDPDVVPPRYRGPFKVEVIAKWQGPGGSHATMPLSSIALPETMRKAPCELVFRQSVSELQKLAQSDGLLMHAWPADAVAKVNNMISRGQIRPEIPMGTLVHAYRQFSPARITGILDAIRTRIHDDALALQQGVPRVGEAGAPSVDPARVVENSGQEPGGASAWDIHIAYLPPHRWDELPNTEHARETLGGHRERPGLTVEPIAWESLRMTPRWLGDDSSNAVAAIQPSNFLNRGAAEWDRFIAGTQARQELALAISMIGSADEPKIKWPSGPTASVSLPVAPPDVANVGGPRIPLARAPSIAEGLGPVDSDLASRLINARDPALPWWSLSLTGGEWHYGGGRSEIVNPTGTLSPLLISAAGEVVAAVWTSSDGAIRHYVIPWMPAWMPVLEWLGQRGIPELVLSAAGRAESKAGEGSDVGETGDSVPSTDGPADANAESMMPGPAASSTSPEPPGAAADVPTRDDRAAGKRRRHDRLKKIGSPFRAAGNSVKKHAAETIYATIAIVVGGLILVYIQPDSGSHGPETSTPSSPTTPTSPLSSAGTTAPTPTGLTTDSPTMSPRPLAPPEEQVIQAGSSGEFFQREVIVGVATAFPSWSALTITTAKLSCTTTNLDVGQAGLSGR